MPFRFRKSIKILPGVKINLSKSGVSTSVGKRGATVNFSKRGTRTTVGIPGTGLSYSSQTSAPKTTQSTGDHQQSIHSQGGNSANNNGGCLGVITLPFRFVGDLVKGLANPESRKSTIILLGVIIVMCCGCYGLTSKYGASSPTATPSTPTQNLEAIIAQTASAASLLTQQAAPSTTSTSTRLPTATFAEVSLEDYTRVASERHETLKAALIEFVELHKQFSTDPSLGQNNDWYVHATAVLTRVVTSANELASMNNYPPNYTAFHTLLQSLANEVNALESNYMVALNNQDANALNLANANLTNAITYLNESSTTLQALTISPTPPPSQTPLPTKTLVVLFPTQPPASGGGGNAVCSCAGDTLNCSDFSSHSAAQACYNYCISQGAGDIHRLDRDHDGSACEG